MRSAALRRHGENINPAYSTVDVGHSTDAARPGGQASGTLRRFAKPAQADRYPTAMGLLKSRFPHAVEFTGIAHEVRGLIILMGVIAAAISIALWQMFFFGLLEDGLEETFDKVAISVSMLFLVMGLYCLIRAIRYEFFRPEDEPIIFDRKNRKIYRLFRETHSGLRGLLKHWPMRAAEYEWDLVDAEHHVEVLQMKNTVTTFHRLFFIVRKSAADPTIIDSFSIGNAIQLTESTVPPLWEYIRQFMEGAGPHFPTDEPLLVPPAPATWWESMGAVGPIGPNYLACWKNQTALMSLYHLLFPLFLPMFLLWGFFNWLSYKTAIAFAWPNEVMYAVLDD